MRLVQSNNMIQEAIERMRGWKGTCRNRLREELYHQLVSVRTGGGGTAEACTKLR
jgi:hypothetical protein